MENSSKEINDVAWQSFDTGGVAEEYDSIFICPIDLTVHMTYSDALKHNKKTSKALKYTVPEVVVVRRGEVDGII